MLDYNSGWCDANCRIGRRGAVNQRASKSQSDQSFRTIILLSLLQLTALVTHVYGRGSGLSRNWNCSRGLDMFLTSWS